MERKGRRNSAAVRMQPDLERLGDVRKPDKNSMYYPTTASSLNKRPLAEIYQDGQKKGPNGERRALQNPATKKVFKYITAKIDSGFKKKANASQGSHVSDGLMAKRKDELFGRLSTHLLAKFLSRKYPQSLFIKKLKEENQVKMEDTGTDFNYVDDGYATNFAHSVRLNKRPITAKPKEKFGTFTQSLFNIDNTRAQKGVDTVRSSQ